MEFKINEYSIEYIDENNKVLAYVTFPQFAPGIVEINHTEVDDSLKGQGIGAKLVQLAYETIKKRNLKVILTCTYAKYYFDKNKLEYLDIAK